MRQEANPFQEAGLPLLRFQTSPFPQSMAPDLTLPIPEGFLRAVPRLLFRRQEEGKGSEDPGG